MTTIATGVDRVRKLFDSGGVFVPGSPVTIVDENYASVYDPGMSILHLRSVAPEGIFAFQEWYDKQPFAETPDQPCFRVCRKHAVRNSFQKSFTAQRGLVDIGHEVPPVRALVATMLVFYLATGERLFPNYYVRSKEGLFVGFVGGIYINQIPPERAHPKVGLASVKC